MGAQACREFGLLIGQPERSLHLANDRALLVARGVSRPLIVADRPLLGRQSRRRAAATSGAERVESGTGLGEGEPLGVGLELHEHVAPATGRPTVKCRPTARPASRAATGCAAAADSIRASRLVS